jgi:5-methylcytosine-specific restriction enzyme subunit McrC
MPTVIPIRNIWLLFLYAADLIDFRDKFSSDVEASRDLPELLGRLLTRIVEQRLRRNLSRGYRSQAAALPRVRGRIEILDTTTRRLLERGLVSCKFEEHTIDTPRNQLVRVALEHLAKCIANDEIAHLCRELVGQFERAGVRRVRPSRSELASDQISRNESADAFMVSLSRMVLDVVIPTEEAGKSAGVIPDTQDHLIRRLFERAIGNALRLELAPQGWQVLQGKKLNWPVTGMTSGMRSLLPGMKTDIELLSPASGRRIVIDTKFTDIVTNSEYREQILKSGYLYQLYAYLRTQERADAPETFCAEGMLLHPEVGGSFDESILLHGHTMRFKTLDLTSGPEEFEDQIRNIIDIKNPIEVIQNKLN